MSNPGGSQTSPATVFRHKQGIVTRLIADETWLVPIVGQLADLGHIYHLNDVGAYVWNQFDGNTDVSSIYDRVVDTYDVDTDEAIADIDEQIEDLLKTGLIEEVDPHE